MLAYTPIQNFITTFTTTAKADHLEYNVYKGNAEILYVHDQNEINKVAYKEYLSERNK